MKDKLANIIKWTLIIGIGGSLNMLKKGDYSGLYFVGAIVGVCIALGLYFDYENRLKNGKKHSAK